MGESNTNMALRNVLRLAALSSLVVVSAGAGCASHYTCCAQWDFFIPVAQTCVENKPGMFGKNNCARNSEGAVPFLARLETPEWRKWGVCNSTTPVITVQQLEQREKVAAARKALYDEFCGSDNKAGCSASETCFFDKEHDSGTGSVYYANLPVNQSVCLCSFPLGRKNTDGTGACVQCKAGADGKAAYVTVPSSTPNATAPVKPFKNGEFACALGASSNAATQILADSSPATEYCWHTEDPAGHKCYEGCATKPFKNKGLSQPGVCNPHLFNKVISTKNVKQCSDGVTNVKYCAAPLYTVTVTPAPTPIPQKVEELNESGPRQCTSDKDCACSYCQIDAGKKGPYFCHGSVCCKSDKECPGSYCMNSASKTAPFNCH